MKEGNRKQDPTPEGAQDDKGDAELKPDGELIEQLPRPSREVFQRPSEKRGAFAVTIKVGQRPGKRGLRVEAEP